MEGIELEFVNCFGNNTTLLNSPSSWSWWRNWDFGGNKNMHAPIAWIIQLWWGANNWSYALDVGSFREFLMCIGCATTEKLSSVKVWQQQKKDFANTNVVCLNVNWIVLWVEFGQQMRCWDEGLWLPKVYVDGSLDLETCILHQKLHLVTSNWVWLHTTISQVNWVILILFHYLVG